MTLTSLTNQTSMNDAYCSMIHGGLELSFKGAEVTAQHCCLRNDKFPVDVASNFWYDAKFTPLREQNKKNIWAPGCENCQLLEKNKQISFRTGMNQGLGITGYDKTGPARINLMFDTSCNLACRSCGTYSSTFWQKHLKDHGEWDQQILTPKKHDDAVSALSKLDLSNLKQLVLSGGEPLLGQTHWEVAKWAADNVPNAKQQLTLCFQTNGTQPIHPRNYKLIDQFHLVKLHISLDGVSDRFGYLRWPADWNQVVDNIMQIRATAPSNTMFLIEETVSIFNFYYMNELDAWAKNNFTANREGDVTHHTRHMARGIFDLKNCTQEYVDAVQQTEFKNLISSSWQENSTDIIKMIAEIKKFDQFRGQSFEHVFPEVAEFYARYL